MKKSVKIIGIIFLLFIAIVGAYAFSVYRSAHSALNEAYIPLETERETGLKLKKEPFSVLLLGIDRDEGRGAGGRSDTIMVVTVNPGQKSTNILSIPRDTRVEIVGRGTDKINHAYAFGGAQLSIDTVKNFLDIPIDFYAEVDMDGFLTLVDTVGGVTVENTSIAFSYDGYSFPLGALTLNSQEALAYTRMRYEDPQGDYGRQARQRDVVTALAKSLAIKGATQYQSIFDTLGTNMKTNMTMSDITSISMNYTKALNEINQLQLRGTGQMIGGVSYQVVSQAELLEAQTILKNHLELN